ncbi:MAG: hypothetical protein WAN43_09905, partial [Rhodomicrobium sp.]
MSRQSHFHHFSGLLLAKFSDKILPGSGICHSGDEIISQGFQLSIRECERFRIPAHAEPLSVRRGPVFENVRGRNTRGAGHGRPLSLWG